MMLKTLDEAAASTMETLTGERGCSIPLLVLALTEAVGGMASKCADAWGKADELPSEALGEYLGDAFQFIILLERAIGVDLAGEVVGRSEFSKAAVEQDGLLDV